MKKVVAFFAVIAVVAAVVSLCVSRGVSRCEQCCSANQEDVLARLQKELSLTPAQKASLEPIEKKFQKTNALYASRMQEANRALAKALEKGDPKAPEIAEAIDAIHHHMGEMQKASIAHLFEMRSVLTPEQGDKLFAMAREALENSR